MLFNSYVFIFAFLPIALVATALCLKQGTRYGVIALLIGSLTFYGYWMIGLLPLLIGSIAFNFLIGRGMARSKIKGRHNVARLLLILGVGGDLALLAYYKYAMLLIGSFNELFGAGIPIPSIVLPIGISFFTFTQIAFLVDVWKGKADEYDPLQYGLFVTYFPHLIAGPILHHRDMIPQFRNPAQFRISADNLAIGLTIFSFGLAKKIFIADNMADAANLVFGQAAAGDDISFAYAWIGVLSYSFQLYFDFSGYSDMAIGLSRMFGIALPLNFNSPYKAADISDFWRRWHITLSQFLRDYLYIPLGGNRHGPTRRYVNLFLTMLLGGLWHGAAWTFAIWGAIHGVMLIVNHLWRAVRPASIRDDDPAWHAVSVFATFLCVTLAWVPFRAENLPVTWSLMHGLFGGNGIELPLSLAKWMPSAFGVSPAAADIWGGTSEFLQMLAWCGGALLIAWFCPNTQQILARYWLASDGSPAAETGGRRFQFSLSQAGWAVSLGALASLMIFALGRQTHFLYFQF